ncbi:digestive organ expansion factor [Lanmaoa asiatica]|nr:digestive organ expansion factor [Lanmaoa asiatica]
MDPEDANTPTTRLLTLLNVSALKSRNRPREDSYPREKLNKRKCINSTAVGPLPELDPSELQNETIFQPGDDLDAAEQEIDESQGDQNDPALPIPYDQHFGPNPEILTERSRAAADQKHWISYRERFGKLNAVASVLPEVSVPPQKNRAKKTAQVISLRYSYYLYPYFRAEHTLIQDDLLSVLSAHLDIYHPCVTLEYHRCIREVITLHALDHVTKNRRRVLKNNDRISHVKSTSSDPPEDVQDQGFTRPSILFLLPFRSSALTWLNALTTHTPSPSFQIENHSRFLGEYGLPPDAVDKLATAPPGTYPPDHVEMFRGNVDDNFRLGIKMTRKSVKLFTDFYNCDLILASPLGLRMSIEKQKSSDFLSSIEILVIDQMNALTMQNWDHFVLSHLNGLPKESHDVDFSRIKPWYLDGFSAYLRQSILLSPFETPETRSLYNTSLKNVAGKVRVNKSWPTLRVPEGIDHTFLMFDCLNPREEADKRFSYFTTQLLPKVLKSAVQSTNTVVFIPSSFDFIRVHNYFRKMSGLSFTVLSEYSSNQDISRARQAFFSGKKAFLLIISYDSPGIFSRYKIRGIRNILFYGPPTHPQFFSEFLTYPFLDDGVDPSDITCRVACCRYDWFKLERILGSRGVKAMLDE